MKKTLATIALLLVATTAQAQAVEVFVIARSPTETTGLSEEPCPTHPNKRNRKLAVHQSFGLEKGTSYGCWWTQPGEGFISFTWHQKINQQRAMPDRVPKMQFRKVIE